MTPEKSYKEKLEVMVGNPEKEHETGSTFPFYDQPTGDLDRSSRMRSLMYLKKGTCAPVTLGNWFMNYLEGLDSPGMDTLMLDLEPYKKKLGKKFSSLPDYFEGKHQRWEEICAQNPEEAGHYCNNNPALKVIQTRIRLGEFGIVDPFDESEYEGAYHRIRETTKLVTNTEAANAMRGYSSAPRDGLPDFNSYTAGLSCLHQLLTDQCRNAGILIDELDFDEESIRPILTNYITSLGLRDPQKTIRKIDAALGYRKL